MADAQVPEVLAAERVRQAAREAAIARAQTAVEPAAVDLGQVKEAVKSFNGAVHQVPDYMHIHCSQILDALRILDRVLTDMIAHDCKSPKDESKPVRFVSYPTLAYVPIQQSGTTESQPQLLSRTDSCSIVPSPLVVAIAGETCQL